LDVSSDFDFSHCFCQLVTFVTRLLYLLAGIKDGAYCQIPRSGVSIQKDEKNQVQVHEELLLLSDLVTVFRGDFSDKKLVALH